MENLFNSFLSLKSFKVFETFDLSFEIKRIDEVLSQYDLTGKEIYLFHNDPFLFTVLFLKLIDLNAFPICLSSLNYSTSETMALINGEWHGNQFSESKYLDKAYSVLTSGTTGLPKRCDFLLKNALLNAKSHSSSLGITKENCIVQTLPVYHSFGIIAFIFTPIIEGCSITYNQGIIGSKIFLKYLNFEKLFFHISPAQARFLLKEKGDVPLNLVKLSIGGGAITILELKILQNKFQNCEIYVTYGLTEAGPRVTTGKFNFSDFQEDNGLDEENWIGSPFLEIDFKLSDESQLLIKSPYMKVNLDENEMNGEWYLTRDTMFQRNNQLFFKSRASDLIKYGGLSIYPKEIENKVKKWSQVTDAIVLKKKDSFYEEIPYLFIEGNLTIDVANDFLQKTITHFHVIKKIIIIESFPKKSLDKVDRELLLKMIG